MNNLETVILLLSVIAFITLVAEKVKIPYPILLVVAGLGIGFVPGLPTIVLRPDLVFLIFLPPLLYAAAWSTSWHDFVSVRRSISLLAIGCVLFTTTGVAMVAHALIPGFTWPLSFVLGSIISPPDALAATAVTKHLGIHRRVNVILEGESLVNDASGLIAYRYAVAAVTTGTFELWNAGLQFVIVSILGILIGLVIGYVTAKVFKFIPDNDTVETSVGLLVPFIAYLTAEALHSSGVLAVVACGLFMSWKSSEIMSHTSRIQANSFWNVMVFMLNGVVFILIGLQLPLILDHISGYWIAQVLFYGVVISITVMVTRILWVFPGAYLPRLSASVRKQEPAINWKLVSIVAWTGMRGVVSLAAALALPGVLPNGEPFPQRNLILFITFCVILFTLVVQGLSLPTIIKWLGIRSEKENEALEEIEARKQLASAAIEHIEENYGLGMLQEEALIQVKSKYELRFNHLHNFSGWRGGSEMETVYNQFHKAQQELIQIERSRLLQMRNKGTINDEVRRKLEYELDLEETRLGTEKVGSQ